MLTLRRGADCVEPPRSAELLESITQLVLVADNADNADNSFNFGHFSCTSRHQ